MDKVDFQYVVGSPAVTCIKYFNDGSKQILQILQVSSRLRSFWPVSTVMKQNFWSFAPRKLSFFICLFLVRFLMQMKNALPDTHVRLFVNLHGRSPQPLNDLNETRKDNSSMVGDPAVLVLSCNNSFLPRWKYRSFAPGLQIHFRLCLPTSLPVSLQLIGSVDVSYYQSSIARDAYQLPDVRRENRRWGFRMTWGKVHRLLPYCVVGVVTHHPGVDAAFRTAPQFGDTVHTSRF